MKCSLILLALILFFAAPVFAQSSPGGPPPVDRRINTDRIRQQDMSSREWQLRNFGNEPGGIKDQRQLKALMAQTEEDFTRILTLHNEIARALSSKNDLDYHFVSDATAEIKKRASRVQSSLHLAPEEGQVTEKPEEFSDLQLKDGLIKLCKQIRSFVTNPSIENPNTIDVQQLTKARRDLEGVIHLSGQIKKDADKLGKIQK
jgi:hypothetical protein